MSTSEGKITVDSKDKSVKKVASHKPGRKLTCLLCREDGHMAKFCRLNKDKKIKLNVCFNCGSNEHILRDCKKPKSNSLSFATCFICNKPGHISKDCPENVNGLYPKGGCCHICQEKTHFSRDCPNRKQRGFAPPPKPVAAPINLSGVGDDELVDDQLFELDNGEGDQQKKKFNLKNKYYAKPKPKSS